MKEQGIISSNVKNPVDDYTHPNHTGDVTSIGDGVTTIANNVVTTPKIANNAVTIAKLPSGATPNSVLKGDGTWEELCPCCDRVSSSLVQPIIGDPNVTVYNEFMTGSGVDGFWQYYNTSTNTWVDESNALPQAVLSRNVLDRSGNIIRFKIEDSKGCIHYSNVVVVQ